MERKHATLKVMDDGTRKPAPGAPTALHDHFVFVVKKVAQVAAIYGVGATYDETKHVIYASGTPAGLFRFCNELGFCKISVACSELKTM